MIHLGTTEIEKIGTNWQELVRVIGIATKSIQEEDYVQPVKPYLRYRDLTNRIIAMPAFLGGDISMSGIKWISSFPANIKKGIPRAHSITVLNDADNGAPLSIISTTIISAIRTAAVTGYFLDRVLKIKDTNRKYKVGITGFGPIGKMHLDMVNALMGDQISGVSIYDLKSPSEDELPSNVSYPIDIVDSWESAYDDADIFMTCTVSDGRYIDKEPKKGSLHLNVSLRDYTPETLPYMDKMVVDDWDEICRESTDVEIMHLEKGLQREDTISIGEFSQQSTLDSFQDSDTIMFNPMGMAVYDVAVAWHYYNIASEEKIGTVLH